MSPGVIPRLGLTAPRNCAELSYLVPLLPCPVFPHKIAQTCLLGSHLANATDDLNYKILPPSGLYTIFPDSEDYAPEFLSQS